MAKVDDRGITLTSSGRVDGRSARKLETRRKVISAAATLFAQGGYAGTSVDHIAEAAGVSKGTIFYNFRNKAELFEQLVTTAAEMITARITEARRGRHGWDALSEAMWQVLQVADEDLALSQIMLTELFTGDRPWSAELANCRNGVAAPLVEIMEELAQQRHAAGLAPVGITREHLANVAVSLVGALVTAVLDRQAFQPDRPLEEVHRGLMMALAGLKPQPQGLPQQAGSPSRSASGTGRASR